MRGPHVFAGYHRDAEATSEAVRRRLAALGRPRRARRRRLPDITGRKKDLIITSSGKNISPDVIESMLRETRWISQAIIYGDRRSYIVALLTLDPDEPPKLAAEAGTRPDPG